MIRVKKANAFKRCFRVRKKEDFQLIYKTGKCFVGFAGILYVFPTDKGYTRIGVAAGKKIGNAVIRNRIKRMMREAYRRTKRCLLPGFDFLWIARTPLKDAKYDMYEKTLTKLCQKAGLLVTVAGENDKCKNSLL